MTIMALTKEPPDEALARQARSSPAAFGELYQRHFERVYGYHYIRTGDVADAQDLTTQTFLAALEGIQSYRGQGSFAAWLLGIARHKVALLFRSRRPQVSLEALPDLPDEGRRTEALAHHRLKLAELGRAIGLLAPERAEALHLCVFGGLSAEDAGLLMGKSAAAVKMLVYRAVKDLRERHKHLLQEEI
jgi:RNA polymerase sigma-70 factor (ECF subfamily)